MSDQEKLLKTVRAMAWERAKGELRSMLQTYWGEEDKFSACSQAIEDFIEHIEGEGIYE